MQRTLVQRPLALLLLLAACKAEPGDDTGGESSGGTTAAPTTADPTRMQPSVSSASFPLWIRMPVKKGTPSTASMFFWNFTDQVIRTG